MKSEKPILSIFEEEHENVIDVVVFIPLKTAQTILKARMDQDQEVDEQTGGTNEEEDKQADEEQKVGEKEINPAVSAIAKRGEELKKARERLAKLKGNIGRTKNNDEEEKVEPEVEIVVKDEFVASGARDKRIKIWNAKKGI